MCTISGYFKLSNNLSDPQELERRKRLFSIASKGQVRGKDGLGLYYATSVSDYKFSFPSLQDFQSELNTGKSDYSKVILIHNRAIPESEEQVNHTQPVHTKRFAIIHNGIIANDIELFEKVKHLEENLQTTIDTEKFAFYLQHMSELLPHSNLKELFKTIEREIKGSYAFAIYDKQEKELLVVSNFMPLAYQFTDTGFFFSSLKEFLEQDNLIEDSKIYVTSLYEGVYINKENEVSKYIVSRGTEKKKKKGIVMASGGLDTCVVAGIMKKDYNCDELLFLHFDYGHKVEKLEDQALKEVVRHYRGEYKKIKLDFLYDLFKDTPLVKGDIDMTGEGMEVALEYVPFRNSLFLAICTSFAEVNGYDYIGTGVCLSEGMAYSDTTFSFVDNFNKAIKSGVGPNCDIKVVAPLVHLLKHEIIKEGLRVNAPMNKTWSCYQDNGTGKHCGLCASCRLRKIGMERNGLDLEANPLNNQNNR